MGPWLHGRGSLGLWPPSLQGNVPTRESIHVYYQNHIMNLSRESGLDTIDDGPGGAAGAQSAHRMDSLDSHDSISRYITNPTAGLPLTEGWRWEGWAGAGCPPTLGCSMRTAQHSVICPRPSWIEAGTSHKLKNHVWFAGAGLGFPSRSQVRRSLPVTKWLPVSSAVIFNAVKMLSHKVPSILEPPTICC